MISIIYVNYKTSGDIYVSLSSIVRNEKNYKNYEYIIVDNNSDDSNGLDKIQKDFPFVKTIYAPRNGGFAYGNNIGINHCSGNIIFLLNPDTYINDNSIEILADRIQSDPAIHIIGPQLLNTDGSNQSCIAPKSYLTLWRLFCDQMFLHRIFRRSKIFNSHLRDYLNPDRECFVQNVSGAAFMFKRDVIEKIGLMDELFFMYFEETDYCLRADKNGLKMLYYPESKITHLIGSSNKPGSEKSVMFFTNSFKLYFKKNFSTVTYYTALTVLSAGSLLRLIIFKLLSKPKYITYIYFLKHIFKNPVTE